MKRLFQLVALATFGLTLGSCDKDEVVQRQGGTELTEPARFELSGSLGNALRVHSLSSNTDEINADDLRAGLFNKGTSSATKTIVQASDFTTGGRQARWGVIYDGGKHYAMNCTNAIEDEPADPSTIADNTVLFKQSTSPNTIEGAKLKMYCRALDDLDDIKHGLMVLEGKAGDEPHSTKQYFTAEKGTDPNGRIQGVMTSAFQAGRHIPIMTDVVEFEKMSQPLATTEVKFGPRGSLIGLHIKNRTSENIIVTGIVVNRTGVFDYNGYFDWHEAGKPASFTAVYSTVQMATNELSFPVYQDSDASATGYTINKDNAEDAMPCFYVWGFQKSDKKGDAFEVKITYKTPTNATEQTTRVFKIKPSTINSSKEFHDGYSYNTILTINEANKSGGASGNDWGNGGLLPNEDEDEGPKTIETYDGNSISFEDFLTPLDFVAEAPAINKAGTGFVTNHEFPHTDVYADINNDEAGYFNWREAKDLFNSNWLKDHYYLPTAAQYRSIIPTLQFHRELVRNSKNESVDINMSGEQSYVSDFITVSEDSRFVTYALRFKNNPKWKSAWRYYADGSESTNDFRMVIQCVPLIGENKDKTFEEIKNKDFFTRNKYSKRIFPAYGQLPESSSNQIFGRGFQVDYWGSIDDKYCSMGGSFTSSIIFVGNGSSSIIKHYTVRPFRRK